MYLNISLVKFLLTGLFGVWDELGVTYGLTQTIRNAHVVTFLEKGHFKEAIGVYVLLIGSNGLEIYHSMKN